MNLSQILKKVALSEKSVQKETLGKYSFMIDLHATKIDVKAALQTLYGVHVKKVNILCSPPKYRLGRARRPLQKRSPARRAIVTLKKGEKLDLTKVKRHANQKS